jgi:hypothetical protein
MEASYGVYASNVFYILLALIVILYVAGMVSKMFGKHTSVVLPPSMSPSKKRTPAPLLGFFLLIAGCFS